MRLLALFLFVLGAVGTLPGCGGHSSGGSHRTGGADAAEVASVGRICSEEARRIPPTGSTPAKESHVLLATSSAVSAIARRLRDAGIPDRHRPIEAALRLSSAAAKAYRRAGVKARSITRPQLLVLFERGSAGRGNRLEQRVSVLFVESGFPAECAPQA